MSKFCNDDPRDHSREEYEDFMKNIEPCTQHKRRTQFICLNKLCENNLLLCVQCITDHRDHSFQKIEKFFTSQKFDRIQQGEGRKHQHFEDMASLVKRKMDQIQKSVVKSIQTIKVRIEDSMKRFQSMGDKITDMKQKIDKHMMLLIKSYLQEQWTYTRCQKMKQTFDKVLNSMQDSFSNLTDDMLQFIQEEDWQDIEQREFRDVEEKWFSHLHPHKQKIEDYFKFDSDQKASNIKLIEGRLQAEYLRSAPGCPFVVCDNYIKEDKTEFVIIIKQCDSKMLFFNASTIYIGVCRPDIVKRMAYSKVNEGGRGTYLIGSNGWSYHHTDPALDRQDIVGFTFGKGDQIHVQVDLKGRGRIKFKKLGKVYDNKFEMSLNMDQKTLIRPCLKPCVGFSDDVGVTVRIMNIRPKEKPMGK